MSESINLIAACAFGLEAIVRRELEQLGYTARVISPGRIGFQGDSSAICRTNLWLRCADRVLISLASFEAKDFDALFDTIREIHWDQWLPGDAKFPVTGKSIKSQLSSVPAIQRTVKKAAVLGMQAAHQTISLEETGAEYKLEISLLNDTALLTLDTTGPSLHRRGYRVRAGDAPLKETLAAAMVQLSFWDRDRPLIDPFCGSGTIPIEAAMIGRNLAPGLKRQFAAEHWTRLPVSLWERARSEANDLRKDHLDERIIGTDIDGKAIAFAQQNAIDADVEQSLHLQVKPFESLSSSKSHGCIITNPPYGERIGSDQDLQALYETIPLVLRTLTTWSHYVLTAYPKFESLIGRPADRRRKLYNGRIECTYFQFYGPKPGSTPSESNSNPAPDSKPTGDRGSSPAAFGQLGDKAQEQADLFRSRLIKRARHLRRLPTRKGVTCYRLYERDIPEIPLVVDRYEDHLHLVEYDRPHDRDVAQHANWLDLMARTAAETLEIPKGQTFLKRKERQLGKSQHQPVTFQEYEVVVHEGGLRFIVNLSDYVDTGLFLDHRQTREMVRKESDGRSMLNLFAYTGSFSVYSASGGAKRTTTVDWSNTYLDWARRNMKLNGFGGGEHVYQRESAIDFLARHPISPTYNLAVVDPPTFSNSKRTDDVWDIQQGYADLLNTLMPLMHPGGIVYFSSNFRRFKFDSNLIQASEVREISKQTIPDEYRNRRIHRCWRIVR